MKTEKKSLFYQCNHIEVFLFFWYLACCVTRRDSDDIWSCYIHKPLFILCKEIKQSSTKTVCVNSCNSTEYKQNRYAHFVRRHKKYVDLSCLWMHFLEEWSCLWDCNTVGLSYLLLLFFFFLFFSCSLLGFVNVRSGCSTGIWAPKSPDILSSQAQIKWEMILSV